MFDLYTVERVLLTRKFLWLDHSRNFLVIGDSTSLLCFPVAVCVLSRVSELKINLVP